MTFLNDLLSAYSSWTQLVSHSPLGAIVTVLEQIATPDGNGGFVIADPQNTPFGDLTDDSTWQAVEQQAKNLWTGTLGMGTDGFAGLDLLGRNALNKLVTQFTTTTNDLVPVIGPATPPIQSNPVNPTPNNNNSNKNGPNDLHVNIPPPGGNGPTDPGTQPPGAGSAPRLSAVSRPTLAVSCPTLAVSCRRTCSWSPRPARAVRTVRATSAGTSVSWIPPADQVPVPPGGDQNPIGLTAISALALSRPNLPGPGGSISADGANFGVPAPDPTGFSSRVIFSSPANGSSSDLSAGLREPGFTGAIGRPGATGNEEDRRRRRAGRGRSRVSRHR